jgi:hypothetical protein
MANPGHRFTIKVDGARRIFLSASVRASSDVTIILKHADHYEHDISDPGTRIVTQRYSLHVSPQSHDYSTVKHTMELENGQRLTSAHVTSVVKENAGRFAILFSRLTPDLRADKYKIGIKDKAVIHNFGEYDPRLFTFSHCLMLGPIDHLFPTYPGDFNTNQFIFGQFRIVLLWSFLTLPSSSAGRLVHNLTVPPELANDPTMQNQLRSFMNGSDPQECINLYYSHRAILTQSWLSVVGSQVPPELRAQMAAMAGYVREASEFSPEYAAHAAAVRSRLDEIDRQGV